MNYLELQHGWKVSEKKYCTSDLHRLIGVENRSNVFSLDNIGANGENLTIAILSMNRSSLTLRLINSIVKLIPNFRGSIYIGDNGSTTDEIRILKNALIGLPYKYEVIEFGNNYGVAGGRNRLFSLVKTDWILSLDNDLYFTSNPLEQIRKDINALGCLFLSLPLVDKGDKNSGIYGGHLYLEPIDGKASIGIGSTYIINKDTPLNVPFDGFLCTGLPGTAAIINKDAFFSVGGFDEGMFVGFEDTEFSVRLFQKGYKVGSCGMISLEHDHPKAEKVDDKNYEKERFSNDKLKAAAEYFEKKHGFAVWNKSVECWVDERQKQTNSVVVRTSNKIKIALVVDRVEWALDHVADQIIMNLSTRYDFIKIYGCDIDNFVDVLILAKDCKIIHVLWRGHLATFNTEYCQQRIRNLGMTRNQFIEQYVSGKVISTEVYDHLLLDGPESEKTHQLFIDPNSIVTNYAVSSQKLQLIYTKIPDLRLRPQAVLSDGVDLKLFKPINLERFNNVLSRRLRIGWVGNSKWIVDDLKGIDTIIKPAIKQLIVEGYNVELVTSDRGSGQFIEHRHMPIFYSKIDCYVCASLYEGTPNPVLEAMACGIPVISTNVGIVEEAFGTLQKEFILKERSIDELVKKIKELTNNPRYFVDLSQENLQSIKTWDWSIRVAKFSDYFDDCLMSIS